MNKSTPVFYRYIRPYNENMNGEIDSQQGVTLRIQLDYDVRKVKFSYSICNHVNGEPSFSKEVGRKLADGRFQYEIPLWDEPGPLVGLDITQFIMNAILDNAVTIPLPRGDRKLIGKMFYNS